MIPQSLVGLLLLAGSLGPGYVYLRVSEVRKPQPERSPLVEGVEVVVLGSAFAIFSAAVVLPLWDWVLIDASALGDDPNDYMFDHPARVLTALAAFLALGFLAAWQAARLVHRNSPSVIKPGITAWHEMLWEGRPNESSVGALVELQDGRRISGTVGPFTSELADNRELTLKAPLKVQADRSGPLFSIADDFMLVRENDIVYLSGTYKRWSEIDPDEQVWAESNAREAIREER